MPQIDLGTGVAIFGGAFACWAWVVAWGVSIMKRELESMKSQFSNFVATQNAHINQTERRLTMLETEFAFVKAKLFHAMNPSD